MWENLAPKYVHNISYTEAGGGVWSRNEDDREFEICHVFLFLFEGKAGCACMLGGTRINFVQRTGEQTRFEKLEYSERDLAPKSVLDAKIYLRERENFSTTATTRTVVVHRPAFRHRKGRSEKK